MLIGTVVLLIGVITAGSLNAMGRRKPSIRNWIYATGMTIFIACPFASVVPRYWCGTALACRALRCGISYKRQQSRTSEVIIVRLPILTFGMPSGRSVRSGGDPDLAMPDLVIPTLMVKVPPRTEIFWLHR